MTKEELYLKTVFCCIACDGYIATEEVKMIREMSVKNVAFNKIDLEKHINSWITEINDQGGIFLQSYLEEINTVTMNEEEQLILISLAIEAIESDKNLEYSEIKFFKKIRSKLSISDNAILAKFPDKEDYLLPDINVSEIPYWDNKTQFAKISIHGQD